MKLKTLLILLFIFTVTLFSQGCEKIKIISREDWGSKKIEYPDTNQKINYITIHHSGEIFEADKNAQKYLRNLQSWCISDKKWVDIPYHLIIDPAGKIYQARPINIPGDTNTNYDTKEHLLINVLGNFEVQKVNEKQLKSLADLIVFYMDKYQVSLDKIKTHKDYTDETVCPGADLYKYFQNGRIFELIKEKQGE